MVPPILDVSATAGAVVVLIGVSGGTPGAHGWRSSLVLELALATSSKLLSAGLAALDDIIKLWNQLMIILDCLEVAQEVLGGVTEETNTVRAFVVAMVSADLVVVILGLFVDSDEIVEVRWLDILGKAGRSTLIGVRGLFLVLGLGDLCSCKLV
jgi:hypothetical protein